MNPAYTRIVKSAHTYDFSKVQEELSQLLADRMKMDLFFSKFLDKVGGRMDPKKPNTPVWKLYKTKLDEYADIQQAIKAAEYYLKKPNV